jgi:hypothetical protein
MQAGCIRRGALLEPAASGTISCKEKWLAKIQEAMAALEADAKLAAEEERRIEAEKQQQRNAEGRKKPGKPAAPLPDEPDPKAPRNFTLVPCTGSADKTTTSTTMANF